MEAAKQFAQAVYNKLKIHEEDFYKLEDVCLFINRRNSIIAFAFINLAFFGLYLLHLTSYSYIFIFLGLYFVAQYFLPIVGPIFRKLLFASKVQDIPPDAQQQRYTIKEVSATAGTIYFLAHKEITRSFEGIETKQSFSMFLTLFILNFVFYFFLSIPDPLTIFFLLNGLLLLPYLLQQKLSKKFEAIQERFIDITDLINNEEGADQHFHDIEEDDNEEVKEHTD